MSRARRWQRAETLQTARELVSRDNHTAASAALSGAIEAGFDDAAIRLLLARSLLAMNRDDEAQVHLARCLELDPRCVAAYRLLGEIAIRADDFTGAALLLRDALRLEPGDERARQLLEAIVRRLSRREPGRRAKAFGAYLVDIGVLQPHELYAAMDYHRSRSVRVGEACEHLGLAASPKLRWAALAYHAGWKRPATNES